MDIEKIIADLKAQGLADDQIIVSLEQMAQEGKISPEDLEKAKQMLTGTTEAEEKAEASKLFGLNLN